MQGKGEADLMPNKCQGLPMSYTHPAQSLKGLKQRHTRLKFELKETVKF